MERNGVEMIFGEAAFIDRTRVRISRGDDNLELKAKNILIACGTEPARPNTVPFTKGRIIDSNELLEMSELPRSMIIVGGGVIGVEYACMFSAVGVRVTLIESRPKLFDFVDDELVESLQFRMRDMGMRLRMGEQRGGADYSELFH